MRNAILLVIAKMRPQCSVSWRESISMWVCVKNCEEQGTIASTATTLPSATKRVRGTTGQQWARHEIWKWMEYCLRLSCNTLGPTFFRQVLGNPGNAYANTGWAETATGHMGEGRNVKADHAGATRSRRRMQHLGTTRAHRKHTNHTKSLPNTSQENRGNKDGVIPHVDTDPQQLPFTIHKDGDGKKGKESDAVHAHGSANDPFGKARTQQIVQNWLRREMYYEKSTVHKDDCIQDAMRHSCSICNCYRKQTGAPTR
jgi:hypothetical protein